MEERSNVRTSNLFAESRLPARCCLDTLSAAAADFGVKIQECLYDSSSSTILSTSLRTSLKAVLPLYFSPIPKFHEYAHFHWNLGIASPRVGEKIHQSRNTKPAKRRWSMLIEEGLLYYMTRFIAQILNEKKPSARGMQTR